MRTPSLFITAVFALLALRPTSAEIANGMGMRDHMRNARYGEIIVVTGGPLSFTGHVYNTLGLNTCPEAQWKALNIDQIKKQYHARAVLLNGPRYFMMDRSSLANPGQVATFGSLQARHLADVDISLWTILQGRAKAYTENKVKRTSDFVYRKGRNVYLLTSPQGVVYVMQTYALIVDPNLTEAQLPTLGSKLKLPPGWKYSVIKLTKDLALRATGTAIVLQDNLENSYQRANLKP